MPIDTSIPLGIRQPQISIQDPIEQYGKAVQLKALLGQGQLQDLQMRQAMQAEQDENAVRDAYKTAGGDAAKLRDLLMQKGAYKQIQALDKFKLEQDKTQAGIDKDRADAASTKSKQDIAALTHGANLLANSKSQSDLDAAISIIDRMSPGQGAVIRQHIPVFDPAKVQQLAQAGLTRAEQLKSEQDRAELEERRRANLEKERNDRAQTGISGGNLSLARQRFDLDKQRFDLEANAPQYIPTENGIVAVPKKPGAGPITGQFVTNQEGQTLGEKNKLTDKQKAELASIESQQSIINGALEQVKKTPGAFGTARGLATMAGSIPESLASKRDTTDERIARSQVFNIVSKAINERAGAAQSAQELARLRSFLPAETDNSQQITDKLNAYKQYLEDSRAGYNRVQTGAPPQAAQTKVFDQMPDPASLAGRRMKAPDGTIYKSNGKSWVRE